MGVEVLGGLGTSGWCECVVFVAGVRSMGVRCGDICSKPYKYML